MDQIKEKTKLVLDEIGKAESVLLHCHPSPDADSVCSALAFKLVLEQFGKKATVIRGDNEIPQAFMHFPGAKDIVMKSYSEIDPGQYDLFIILDSSLTGVSRKEQVRLPEKMRVINIDHHRTNKGDGHINIVDPKYPANAQLLFDLFNEMNVKINSDIATNLFMGIFTDTGGFKYEGTSFRTFEIASELIKIAPDISNTIAKMENSRTIGDLEFEGLALTSLETACEGRMLMSVIPYSKIASNNIPDSSISAGQISPLLKTVAGFDLYAVIIEPRPNKIKISFRTSDSDKYDVSVLSASLGGGGHKAASGAVMDADIGDAKNRIVSKVKELYNF